MSGAPSLSSGSSTAGPSVPATPPDGPICSKEHALYCFDVLVAHFEGREPIEPPFANAKERYALFVTWNTSEHHRSSRKPALRGCIGNFSPMPLADGLREYALISALQDRRFDPIDARELPYLSVSVSLLTPFVPIPDPLAWTPGADGIHITFTVPATTRPRQLSATYLPEVCPEQGWTKEETVLSAISKAGYRGRVEVGDDIWQSLQVKRYGSEKGGANYQVYKDWR